MAINEDLRRIRELQGMSLRKAAQLTDISPSTLSRLENGAMPPSPNDLAKFARVYRMDYNTLMKIAGYLESNDDQTTPHLSLLAEIEVTEDEAAQLLEYLEFIRWQRSKR